jgi:LysR family glycine cleavage system transcriptional activator
VNVPPLQSLRTLEVLSRHRRIGSAAAELGLTHSAVSQTVSRLESRFGVQLFLKNSWGLEATPQCKTLVDAYVAASAALARALDESRGERRFRILIPKTSWAWLSPAIERLYRRQPDLSFRTYQDEDALDLEAADFAVVASGHVPPSGFEGAALYDERLIPVCSPTFADTASLATPSRLARSRLLISRRDHWLSWFSQAGLVSAPSIEGPLFADPALAMETALRGQGVALCCTVAATAAIARGELIAPVPVSVGTERRLWAIWKRAQSDAAAQVLNWLLPELTANETPHISLVEETVRQAPAPEARNRGGYYPEPLSNLMTSAGPPGALAFRRTSL